MNRRVFQAASGAEVVVCLGQALILIDDYGVDPGPGTGCSRPARQPASSALGRARRLKLEPQPIRLARMGQFRLSTSAAELDS